MSTLSPRTPRTPRNPLNSSPDEEGNIGERINIVLLSIKDKSPEEILNITLKLIQEGSISVVERLFDSLIKPLDKNGQLRIAIKMIEEGEAKRLIEIFYKFRFIHNSQDVKEIVLACIRCGADLQVFKLFDYYFKSEEDLKEIALAMINYNYFFRNRERYPSDFDYLISKIKSSTSNKEIAITLVNNGKIHSLFYNYLYILSSITSSEDQKEVVLNCIRVGEGIYVLENIEHFKAIKAPEDLKEIFMTYIRVANADMIKWLINCGIIGKEIKSSEDIKDIALSCIKAGWAEEIHDFLRKFFSLVRESDRRKEIVLACINTGATESVCRSLDYLNERLTAIDFKEVVFTLIKKPGTMSVIEKQQTTNQYLKEEIRIDIALTCIKNGNSNYIFLYPYLFLIHGIKQKKDIEIMLLKAMIDNGHSKLCEMYFFMFKDLSKDQIFDIIKDYKNSSDFDINSERKPDLDPSTLCLEFANKNLIFDLIRCFSEFPSLKNDNELKRNIIITLLERKNKRGYLDFINKLREGADYNQNQIVYELIKLKRFDIIIFDKDLFNDIFIINFIINPELTYSSIKAFVKRTGLNNTFEEVEKYLKAVNATPIQKLTIVNATYEALCEIKYSQPVIN